MKGHTEIISGLNRLLNIELSARDHFFRDARLCQDWGLEKLYAQLHHEMEDEIQHATLLIERIIFLEGIPDMTVAPSASPVAKNVKDIFEKHLSMEMEVAQTLRNLIALCEEKRDYQTRETLMKLLSDTEEDHIYYLEKQLRLIQSIGMQNYLQSHL